MNKKKVNKTATKKKKSKNNWTEEDLNDALHEVDSVPGASIRAVSKKYGMDESTLRFRLRKRRDNVELKKPGRK